MPKGWYFMAIYILLYIALLKSFIQLVVIIIIPFIILATNYIKDFNNAMQSRIYVAIKYPPLGTDTRQDL